jgi:methionyl-tRNA formyltransferase
MPGAEPRALKVGFAGTPEFAATALRALLEAGIDVPLVLTQPDRPAGRGMKLQASPVKQLAQAHGIPVLQPRSLRLDGKSPEDADTARVSLAAAGLDALVVAAYGLILPRWVLDLPRLGCLNIHASLLPRWRGAAPIHRAIEAGDAETGVTIMQMDEGLDTGDMLLSERVTIGLGDTTGGLHDRLADLGGRLILRALADAAAGRLVPVPQPKEGITYAHKIEKAEAAIDWRQAASVLARRVRAFDPFPGATTAWGTESLKIWAASAEGDLPPGAGKAVGEVLSADEAGVLVQCGRGCLRLTTLQRAGGKRLGVSDFLRGVPLTAGQRLGAQACS